MSSLNFDCIYVKYVFISGNIILSDEKYIKNCISLLTFKQKLSNDILFMCYLRKNTVGNQLFILFKHFELLLYYKF